MAINVRVDGDVVVLSNIGRLMNDPRHFDAGRDVEDLLDRDYRKFAIELRGVHEIGASGLGLLMTITRLVRRRGGDVVLVAPSRGVGRLIEEWQMDTIWERVDGLDDAKRALG
jgi:anti-sigma B factor antagonist